MYNWDLLEELLQNRQFLLQEATCNLYTGTHQWAGCPLSENLISVH